MAHNTTIENNEGSALKDTKMTQNLGFYDECSISELLSAAYSLGAESVDVTDSCGDTAHFYFDSDSDAVEDAVIELLDGGDEEYAFSFYKGDSEHEQHLGTFYVVLGNDDGSAVYDSSCQPWCNKVWDGIS